MELICGDALEKLKELPSRHVQCCVTSPPYWGLRDYGVSGQLGLEKTPEEYIEKLVEIFREVKRILRDDGTLWLNLGDSYAGSWSGNSPRPEGGTQREGEPGFQLKGNREKNYPARNGNVPIGLKPKDPCGMPWRVAFALQADGWYLRSDIIWYKRNPMPESVTDRPTKAHEYIFLLTKNQKYYYDAEAIREPGQDWGTRDRKSGTWQQEGLRSENFGTDCNQARTGRNSRTVWDIPTQSFPEAHFATFPEQIPKLCILAGTSPQACEICGSPWERIIKIIDQAGVLGKSINKHSADSTEGMSQPHPTFTAGNAPKKETVGWKPTCSHKSKGTGKSIVLDPFAGSFTVGQVASELGRNFIVIELKPEYVKMGKKRISQIGMAL